MLAAEVGDADDLHRRLSLDATHEVLSILSLIIQTLYKQNSREPSVARGFLSDLTAWSSCLDPSLKSHSLAEQTPLRNQEAIIGNMHVACSYYFATSLATRKFLIIQLASHLNKDDRTDSDENPIKDTQDTNSETAMLAETCVESSMLTLQLGKEVLDANMMLGQMCILQYVSGIFHMLSAADVSLRAWTFAASIVLGFFMFYHTRTDCRVEEAFESGQNVLRRLSKHSPQAKRCLEILCALHDAVQEHRRQMHPHRDGSKKLLVTQIFKIAGDHDISKVAHAQDAEEMTRSVGSTQQFSSFLSGDSSNAWSTAGGNEHGGLGDFDFANIDATGLQLLDEMVFNLQGAGEPCFGL